MQKHAKLNENETILKQYLQKHKNCMLDKRFQEKKFKIRERPKVCELSHFHFERVKL